MAPSDDVYTHGHDEAVLRSHRWRTAANSAAYLLPHLRPGMRVLDVGCGPGTLTVDLARHVAPGAVVGIDPSPTVIDAARRFAADAGDGPAVSFVVGALPEVDLPARSFDVVHAHQVLQHLRDPVGALAAMAGLARPGGLVAVRDSDYAAMSWAPADPRLDAWSSMYHAVTARNGAEADAGRHLPRWARAAGLAEAAYTTSTWTFALPADRAWWGDLWADRVRDTELARQAVDYGVATTADLAAMAEGFLDWAVAPDAVFTVVHGEIVARV